MQRIKFYKTFSTSNLLILGVVLLAMGFSSYKILFSEAEDVSTYVIINSLVVYCPLSSIVTANKKHIGFNMTKNALTCSSPGFNKS